MRDRFVRCVNDGFCGYLDLFERGTQAVEVGRWECSKYRICGSWWESIFCSHFLPDRACNSKRQTEENANNSRASLGTFRGRIRMIWVAGICAFCERRSKTQHCFRFRQALSESLAIRYNTLQLA